MIRVTAECSTTIARFTIQEVHEQERRLSLIGTGFTLRDLKKLGIERADVENLRITESRDFTKPNAAFVRSILSGARVNAALEYWTARGFTRICTGGNCYAWERTLRTDGARPVQILITGDEYKETRSLDETHDVGFYLEGEGESFDFHTARNAASAWAWITETPGIPSEVQS